MKWNGVNLLLCLVFLVISHEITGCASKKNDTSTGKETIQGHLQPAGPGICLEVENGRMWQVERSKMVHSPQDAEEYARNLVLGGYSDWRLPTERELFSLYNIFFWKNNGDCSLKHKGDYWTAREEGAPSPGRWETDYLCAPIPKYVKSIHQKGYVRAIRP